MQSKNFDKIHTLNWGQNSHCVFMDSSVSIILSSNNSSGIGNILLTDARLFRFVLACSVSPRMDYEELKAAFFRKCDVFFKSTNLQKKYIPKSFPELEM